MKHFLTASVMLCSFLAAAQFPNFPYNPDENGDGLIGVVDLQGLLANYGNEFASAVVSEDGESAIVYIGDTRYSDCSMSCRLLPGLWQIADLTDLSLVWSEVAPESAHQNLWTWINSDATWNSAQSQLRRVYSRDWNSDDYETIELTNRLDVGGRCYCAAKQLPRVEYSYCFTDNPGDFGTCTTTLVEEGWYPLSSQLFNGDLERFHQAFWRFAQ